MGDLALKTDCGTSALGDVKPDSSTALVKPEMPASSDNNRRRTNLLLKFVWCGCFASREQKNVPKEPSVKLIDSSLLPSSAVHCMFKPNTTCYGENVPSDTAKPDVLSGARNNVELPSSVLITNSILSSVSETYRKNSQSSHECFPKSTWRGIRFHIPSFSRLLPRHTEGSGHKDVFTVLDVSASSSVVNGQDEIALSEALVFSPLPTHNAPEISNVQNHTTLLGPRSDSDKGKKCFVIDLDETLVHSSFKVVEHADFKVGVEIDGVTHRVYVLKRPHVDIFLSTMANLYECVLFTASLAKYADPVADFIDKWNAFRYRLFRESCVYHRGNYVKDLSHLGRPINQVVILDNSPASYMFHASHAVQISSWFDDANDRALLDLIPYFERLASHPNVVEFLRNNAPPTPHAAVGTVGLPLGTLAPIPPASDLIGRSVDNSGVISNLRRPTVASPFPSLTQEFRGLTRPVPVSISEAQTQADSRKAHGLSTGPTRFISSHALPVITKMASPSSGPSISPANCVTDPNISFPAPLSLATYIPVPSHNPAAISTTNRLTGNVSQTRLVNNRTTNSHNLRSTSLRSPPESSTPDSTSSIVTGISSLTKTPDTTALKDSSFNLTIPHPPSIDRQPQAPGVDPAPNPPRCSSSGENHCSTYSSTPHKSVQLKNIADSTTPTITSSPRSHT